MNSAQNKKLWLVAALALVLPSVAQASEGGGMSADALETVLILLGVVTIAYAVSHIVSEWVQRKWGIVTGVEYIILGAVVGPGLNLLNQDIISQVSPAIVLGTGSIGVLTGLQLNIRRMLPQKPAAMGAAFAITLGTATFMVSVPLVVWMYFAPDDSSVFEFLPHVMAAVAISVVADQYLTRTLVGYLQARGEGVNFLLRVGRFCAAFGVVILGVIFSFNKQTPISLWFIDTPTEASLIWFGLHIAVGAALGLLFTVFLLREVEREKILTIAIGMVILASGIAYYLELSPIFVNFVLGLVLSNTSKASAQVEAMFLSVEKPLYIVLFFFAGAMLSFQVPWWSYLLFLPFLAVRFSGRILGGVVAGKLSAGASKFPPMGLALLGPGGLSVAMALDYLEVYENSPYASATYLTLIVGIVASEILAYRWTRRWIIDATDVSPDLFREEGA